MNGKPEKKPEGTPAEEPEVPAGRADIPEKVPSGQSGEVSRAPVRFFRVLGRGLLRPFGNDLFRLTFVLFAVAAISALLLGFVYNVTAPLIAEYQADAAQVAMRQVLSADTFEKSDATVDSSYVTAIYLAREAGRLTGYAVEASAPGYGGQVGLVVGVDLQGQITGVVVTDHSETPGLGSRAKEDPSFTEQFKGQGAGVTLGREVDAISGATITSKAVTDGVNAAVGAVLALQAGGGTGE